MKWREAKMNMQPYPSSNYIDPTLNSPLRALVSMRWRAILAQFIVVGAVIWIWNPKLPLVPIFSILGLAAITNLILDRLSRKDSSREKQRSLKFLTGVFVLDVCILTALLALSGGPANPFSMLYLLHVILAAVMTTPKITWFIVALSSAGFALLFQISTALPTELGGHGHQGHNGYSAHLQGMWVAYIICASALAVFVSRMSTALLMESEKRQRTARLFGLATLAAGAAHEIGNPLGTIRLVTSELENKLKKTPGHPEILEDVLLISDEVTRATQVLKRLQASSAEISGEPIADIEVQTVVEDAIQQVDRNQDRIITEFAPDLPKVRWPLNATSQVFAQLLRNAIIASSDDAPIHFRTLLRNDGIAIEIIDQGCGMPEDILKHVGQPFFTTREGEGMGLGVFIASSLTEHLGGQLKITSTESVGTQVYIWLPTGINSVRYTS